MNGEAWRRLLSDASERVQVKVAGIAKKGEASTRLGVGASGDVTLLADKRAEQELFKALEPVRDLRIVSEEAGARGDARGALVAVVDPLDGSSNFSRGIPFYCTSVAVAVGGSLADVTWGLIRNLVNGDVYWSEKGKGSYKNGRRINGSGTSEVKEAVVDIDISRSTEDTVARLAPLVAGAGRQVHYGANALELCLLAEGKIDAFVDLRRKMRMTDFAAGHLIAIEAGAEMSLGDSSSSDLNLDLMSRVSFVAAGNRRLHSGVLDLIA